MIEAIKKHKRIVAAVVILILTAVIELVCNFPAIRGGYDNLDLTKYITVENEGNKEKYVISYSSPKKFYIKELKLSGTFPKEYSYTIKTKEYNSFDKESEEYYSDTVNSWFSDFYTNLNKKVTSIEITLKKVEDAELTAVSCSNRFEINKYRVLFFIVAFSLLYCLLFEKKIYKKLEWLFVVYALIFGLLLVFYGQPVRYSWDEQIHFGRAYSLAYTKTIKWNEAALNVKNDETVQCNTKAEFAELRQCMDAKGKAYVYSEIKDNVLPEYTMLAYLPQALFLRIGMAFNMSFTILFAFGKLGNLLLYIVIMFWAIRCAKIKKIFLTFFSLMPTMLWLAASYTYDSVVISFITLGCVLWANEMYESSDKMNVPKIISMVFLLAVGCFAKAVYIPIILLIALLPNIKRCSKKERCIIYGGIILIFLLVLMTFVLPTLTSTVAKDISVSGDARGGDTGIVRQVISMLKHPIASIKLMVGNIVQLDNFRNIGVPEYDNFFFGNLMLVNFANLGILNDKWSALLIPIILLMLLYKDPSEKTYSKLPAFKKIIMVFLCIGTVVLIWLALYLSFTPVGEETIAGVQARYYLPLLYLFALAFRNIGIGLQCKSEQMKKIVSVAVYVMGFVLMYQCLLDGRLI